MEAERYVGRKVRIILKNNFHYTGLVIDTSENKILIKDKFSNDVLISLDDISLMEVLQENGNN